MRTRRMQSKTSTSQHVKLASLIAIIIIITEHIAERICTIRNPLSSMFFECHLKLFTN